MVDIVLFIRHVIAELQPGEVPALIGESEEVVPLDADVQPLFLLNVVVKEPGRSRLPFAVRSKERKVVGIGGLG